MSDATFAPGLGFQVLLAAWALGVYTILLHERVVRRVRASGRDAGLGWWVGGTVCLGTASWAISLLIVVGLGWPVGTQFSLPLVAVAWVPATTLSALTLWFGGQVHMRPTIRGLFCLAGAGFLQVTPFVLVLAMMHRPSPQWQWLPTLLSLALAFGTALLMGWWHLRAMRAPISRSGTVSLALMVGTLTLGSHLMLLSAVALPAGTVSMGERLLPADALGPLLSGVIALLLAMLHVGTVQDERLSRREAMLAASLAQVKTDMVEAANRDPLTQLLNRQGFDLALEQAVAQGCKQMAVMLVNLDGFRPMVEHYGYAVGDALLRQVGNRLRGLVRSDDVVARVGGDEFLLLLHQPGDGPTTAHLAQRLGDVVRQPVVLEEADIELTCSIGVALYPDEPRAERLFDRANEALLAARGAGGAAHCVFESGMGREVQAQVLMQRDLRHAVERGEMMLHFQPKLQAMSGELAGVEALLRWRHPERGMVSPAEFIPVAERFGLIGELGTWVLDEACRQIRVWLDAGLEVPVAVNVSVHQLRQTDLEVRVRDALVRHQVPARLLTLEITESVAMENIDSSLRVFDMLDSIGVPLSIDDFGTGYSSLSYLRRLPATQLKVDRSFVRDLDDGSEGSAAIVEAVVRLAHALKLKVVAEGVETQSQAARLRGLGCDELQGFLFARPMSPADLLTWLVQGPVGLSAWPAPASPAGFLRPSRHGGLSPV